jgi:catechol 2,3-dioxygenase-like lactoylglutathione lyase family enzyme
MTAMDITIHGSFLPHNDPDASLAFYRDTLGFEVRNDVGYGGMRWITVGPADQPDTSIVLEPPAADPGVTDDERRTILEMMAKGSYAASSWPPPTSTAPSRGCRPAAPTSSRSRRSSRTGSATARSAIPRAT